jgi:hypothetical protein
MLGETIVSIIGQQNWRIEEDFMVPGKFQLRCIECQADSLINRRRIRQWNHVRPSSELK